MSNSAYIRELKMRVSPSERVKNRSEGVADIVNGKSTQERELKEIDRLSASYIKKLEKMQKEEKLRNAKSKKKSKKR